MTQETFQAKQVIDDMRSIFKEENQLLQQYKDIINSPQDMPSQHRYHQQQNSVAFTPSHSQGHLVVNKPGLIVIEESNRTSSNSGLTGNWKKNGLLIISLIIRFVYQLKIKTESMKYKLMTKRIYSIIGDQSADYQNIERYRLNRYFNTERSAFEIKLSHLRKQVKGMLQCLGQNIPVFLPDSGLVIFYQSLMIVCIVMNLFYIPINISFINEENNIIFQILPLIIQTIWIILHFNIAFYQDQTLKTNRHIIASNYIRSYLFMDVCIVAPFIFQSFIGNYIEMTFILKIFQLRRLQNQFEYNNNFKDNISALIDLFKLIITLLFITHCCACSWHYLGVFERDILQMENNWITNYELGELPWIERYITSLYFSVITTLTVGYGDITPQSRWEQLFVVLVAMNLCGLLGYTITNIGEIFKSLNEKKIQFQLQMKAIEKIIKQRGLNDKLQIKVRKYFQNLLLQEQEENSQGELLMNRLTKNLEEEVMIDSYKRMLSRSILLRHFNERTIEKLCTKIEVLKYAPGDEIIKAGQFANSLIFVQQGELNEFATNAKSPVTLKTFRAGAVIGEQEFAEQGYYDYTLLSYGYSKVAVLYRNVFMEVLQYDSQEFEKICKIRDQSMFDFNHKNFVGRVCEICQWTHGYLQCPFTFFQPDKWRLVKRLTANLNQNRCDYHLRRIQKSATRRDLQHTQQQCLDFMYNNKILDDNSLNQEQTNHLEEQFKNHQFASFEESSINSDRENEDLVEKQFFPTNNLQTNQLLISIRGQQFQSKRESVHTPHQLHSATSPRRTPFRKTSQLVEKKSINNEFELLKTSIQELANKFGNVIEKDSKDVRESREPEKKPSIIREHNEKHLSLASQLDKGPKEVDLDFEVMQSYKHYFPQFNIANVIDQIHMQQMKLMQKNEKGKKNSIRQYISRRRKFTKLKRVIFERP